METTHPTARIDMQRLQLLNDRIAMTLDALNQLRMSVHAVQPGMHNSFMGQWHGFNSPHVGPFASPFVSPTIGGSFTNHYANPMFGATLSSPYVNPYAFSGIRGGLAPSTGFVNPWGVSPINAGMNGVNPNFSTVDSSMYGSPAHAQAPIAW